MSNSGPPRGVNAAPRFDRKSWLRAAMEVLAREGQAKLRVDAIAASLGVTKGSFYHHFKNREDFVACLLDFWAESFTTVVIERIGKQDVPARKRLLDLAQLIEQEGLDRYDIAFRSWAAQDPKVAEIVKRVDLARYAYVHSLFKEMGYEGDDLEMRARTFVVFASSYNGIHFPDRPSETDGDLVRFLDFLTS